jgi:hypothetical protein
MPRRLQIAQPSTLVWPLDGATGVSTQPTIVVWTDLYVWDHFPPRLFLASAIGDYRIIDAIHRHSDAAEPGAQYIFSVDEPLVEGQNYEVFLEGVRSEAGQVEVSSGFQTISGSTSFYDYSTLLPFAPAAASNATQLYVVHSTPYWGATDVPAKEEVVLTFTFSAPVLVGYGKARVFYGGEGYTFDTVAYEMWHNDTNFVINDKVVQLRGFYLAAGVVYKVELPAGIVKSDEVDSAYFDTIFRTLSLEADTTPPVFVAGDPFMQAVGSEGTQSAATDYVTHLGFKIQPSTRKVHLAFSEPVVGTPTPAIIEVGMPGSGNLVESDYGEHTFMAVEASVSGRSLIVDFGDTLTALLEAGGFRSYDNWPRRGWMLRIPAGAAMDLAGNPSPRADVRFSLDIPVDPTFETVLVEPAYQECPADGKPDILRLDMPMLCAAQDTGASLTATSDAEVCEGVCWTQTSGAIMPLTHLVPKEHSGGLNASCHARCASASDTLGRSDGRPACNGYPEYGAEMEPALLCLSRKECEELCIAESDCVGFDMHKTLDRCWLNAVGGAIQADEDYNHVHMRTCNGKDFWWPAFNEAELTTQVSLTAEELGNHGDKTCVAKCRNLQPCAGDDCLCDGAIDDDPAALCLRRESCEDVCAAIPTCRSMLSHRSLPRCFLFSDGPDLDL